jgi:hypothetical protein
VRICSSAARPAGEERGLALLLDDEPGEPLALKLDPMLDAQPLEDSTIRN